MSYHIYTTEGIILKRTTYGEANVLLYVLTHDLGLILATARSARLAVSKLRPALQEYAHVSVSCIKGKGGWKITNVVEKGNFYFENPQFTHKVMYQIVTVLVKMISGEVPNKEIFQTIKSGFEFLRNISEKDVAEFEILAVLRVLHELGYVVKNSDTKLFLEDGESWDDSILGKVKENKRSIVAVINKALKESHL
ncbi:MAG: hypothetical protein EXS47_01460 [Candidatus Zambryskibacteria bacterium]|nr:hypothetical protein [Candidatus Zambryskibacteria bacterium]